MDRKWICLFIIFLAAIMAMGSVDAAELKDHNFKDYFSMKIPKNAHFQKQNDSSHENGLDMISLSYISQDLVIFYENATLFSENSSKFLYQSMFESSMPDLDECYEYQEGNLTILEPKKIDDTHFPLVGITSGNEYVIIAGKDLDLIKKMGKSVDFK